MTYLKDDSLAALEERNLRTMWDIHDQWGSPDTDLEPYLWEWETIRESLRMIEEEAPLEDLPQGIRRSLALCTPGSDITSPTIAVFYQTVTPGEVAGAHRHNVSAFRFVVEGNEEMYTVVEGEEFPMESGDLILTPNWTYHDHVNNSDETAIWVDVLDWPFIGDAVKAPIFDNHSEFQQPVDKEQGYYNSQFGRMRPANDPESGFRDTPAYRFSWEDTYETLTYAADNDEGWDPYNGYNLEYVNPETGQGPVMSTIELRQQLLRDGDSTKTHKHNTTEVYYVVKGSGTTDVDDDTIEWSEKDSFVVPAGTWHAHETQADESILFAMSDRPIFDAFNIYHEERREE
ncbi:MAG: cupin domain-containing protein [Halobacteriota archaeon]